MRIFLFSLFFTATVFAQPCCVDWFYCTGTKPGLYLGAQAGYAWVQTPDKNDRPPPRDAPIIVSRNRFAWGIFVGVNACLFRPNLYLGLETAYNSHGYTTLQYTTSNNIYRLHTRDWSIVATATYVFCNQFDLFFKLGPARVREIYQLYTEENPLVRDPDSARHQWAPTVTAGVGWNPFNYINFSVQYRGVYCTNQSNFTSAFRDRSTVVGASRSVLKSVATVHSLLGGLCIIF